MYYDIYESFLGKMLIVGDDEGLKFVNLQVSRKTFDIGKRWIRDRQGALETEVQLNACFKEN